MVSLANTARKEGVLALEEKVQEFSNPFIKMMVMFLVDGVDPDFINDIGETVINAGGHRGKELLEQLIILDGVKMVQRGKNPRMMEVKLFAMLGDEFIYEPERWYGLKKEELYTTITLDEIRQRIAALPAPLPGGEEFSEILLMFTNHGMHTVLRNYYNYNQLTCRDFILAIIGSDHATRAHILENLSSRVVNMVLEEIVRYIQPDVSFSDKHLSEVNEVRKKIINSIRRMIYSGDISFSFDDHSFVYDKICAYVNSQT
jgi:hypothetical protein